MNRRSNHLVVALSLGILIFPLSFAHAGDMNLSLKGLSSSENCAENGALEPGLCPNNELFEKLMAQFGITLAPPVNLPADTLGQRGFFVGMNTTVTFIDRESAFWRQGVEAEGDSISDSYFWYRLEQRKGFPFGFELGASQGYAMQTDMFSLGLQLRWSLFEGFRSGVGQLPDFAIRGSIQTLIGSRQVNLTVPSLDFVLSKPVSIDQGWIVSPYLGIQAVWIIASSEMVNLCYWESSDDSADESRLNCSENQQADTTLGSGNNRVFDDVQQTRWRMAVGMQGRYDIISATFAVIFDLAEPGVKTNQEKEAQLSRQIGLTFGFGMTY